MASQFSTLPSIQVGLAQQSALLIVLKSHPGSCREEHCPFKEASLETPSVVLVGSSRAPPCLLENASQVIIPPRLLIHHLQSTGDSGEPHPCL